MEIEVVLPNKRTSFGIYLSTWHEIALRYESWIPRITPNIIKEFLKTFRMVVLFACQMTFSMCFTGISWAWSKDRHTAFLPFFMRKNGTSQRFETKKHKVFHCQFVVIHPCFFWEGVGLNINDAQLSLFWINSNRWLPICTPWNFRKMETPKWHHI